MKFSSPYLLLPALIAIFAISAQAADSVSTAQTGTETITAQAPRLTQKQAQAMSADAIQILKHVNEAQDNLKIKKYDLAKNELNQAQALVDSIRAQMPTITVKDSINVAQKHITTETNEKVLPDFVPIYESLTVAEDYVPTQTAKAHVDKAKQYLQSGDKKSAMNELKMADASISYTEVDLPLNETQKNIKDALAAIDKKQVSKAREDLAKVDGNLQIDFSSLVAEKGPNNNPPSS